MATKPSLHLSPISPTRFIRPPRSPSPSAADASDGDGGDSPKKTSATGRRITSWGSATSDSGSHISLRYADADMTPLPSPVGSSFDPWKVAAAWDPSASEGAGGGGAPRSASPHSDSSQSYKSASLPSRSKTSSFFSTGSDSSQFGVLSPPPNPPSRNNSLSSPRRAPRRSWLDTDDKPGALIPPAPILPRRRSDSPEQSPTLASFATAGAPAPLPPAPPLPSFGAFPPNPSAATTSKPILPAITTSLKGIVPRSRTGSTSSPLPSALNRPLSQLPSAVEPPLHPGARFLKFGPPSRLGTIDIPSSSSTSTTPIRSPATSQPPSRGVTPTPSLDAVEHDYPPPQEGEMIGAYQVQKILGKGSFSRVALATWKGKGKEVVGEEEEEKPVVEGLVALKLIARKSYDDNERMKISVIREVEVLKRIHHPSLVSLLQSYSTPIYTVLVLDYCPGGELFDFLTAWHTSISEALARRMFGELCLAVGWMHSIFLVHRDIKLENILLCACPFPTSSPSTVLDHLPTPFIKITDFGLSRFISPSSPLLSTRCGSEAYAAPELIMGKKYDGRKTDAWALGVVLFAIITGGMPFVEDLEGRGRKSYLLKIAKGEYKWPATPTTPVSPTPTSATGATAETTTTAEASPTTPSDAGRLVSTELKALVGRLLVRDPEKRASVEDVWEMEWMQGEGRPVREEGWVSPKEAAEVLSLEETWRREDEI